MTQIEQVHTAETAPKPDEPSLNTLYLGAAKTLDNAERLFHEAEILAAGGAVARALCLHQISLEECSKVDNLGAWAVSLVLGVDVNKKQVLAAFSRHASKNKSNAYMLEASASEKEARIHGDWTAAMEAFRQAQQKFHEMSNRAKNASLYVDWIDGSFVAPSERITQDMLAETRGRNAEFLGYANNGLRTLERLLKAPDQIRDPLARFVERAKRLREERPDDLIAAMEELMSQFFEDGKRELKD